MYSSLICYALMTLIPVFWRVIRSQCRLIAECLLHLCRRWCCHRSPWRFVQGVQHEPLQCSLQLQPSAVFAQNGRFAGLRTGSWRHLKEGTKNNLYTEVLPQEELMSFSNWILKMTPDGVSSPAPSSEAYFLLALTLIWVTIKSKGSDSLVVSGCFVLL